MRWDVQSDWDEELSKDTKQRRNNRRRRNFNADDQYMDKESSEFIRSRILKRNKLDG